jgi:hypothetical protein
MRKRQERGKKKGKYVGAGNKKPAREESGGSATKRGTKSDRLQKRPQADAIGRGAAVEIWRRRDFMERRPWPLWR